MEAFSILVPAGWSFEDDIRWSPDNVYMPATCGFTSAGDGITVRALPGQAFTWTSLMQVRLSHPIGSGYLGGVFCPRLGATDYIKEVIVPSLRQRADGVTVTDQGPSGIFDGALGFDAGFESTGTASTEGGRLRIEYDERGKRYEEELFCTVTSFAYRIPAGGSDINFVIWMADNAFSFRAEKGILDENVGILQAMLYSFKLNPGWLGMYHRIVVSLKESQALPPASLRELLRGADGPAAVDGVTGYMTRHLAYSWIAGSLGRARATVEYYDPVLQACVHLPANYGRAWANGLGNYALSGAGDLPPGGFAGIWKMMEPMGLEVADPGQPAMGIS